MALTNCSWLEKDDREVERLLSSWMELLLIELASSCDLFFSLISPIYLARICFLNFSFRLAICILAISNFKAITSKTPTHTIIPLLLSKNYNPKSSIKPYPSPWQSSPNNLRNQLSSLKVHLFLLIICMKWMWVDNGENNHSYSAFLDGNPDWW